MEKCSVHLFHAQPLGGEEGVSYTLLFLETGKIPAILLYHVHATIFSLLTLEYALFSSVPKPSEPAFLGVLNIKAAKLCCLYKYLFWMSQRNRKSSK